jgi:steroid delta-isomerase
VRSAGDHHSGTRGRAGGGRLASPPSAEHITETVNRYLELVAKGSADEIADLYADDATVEDPVGGEVHIGRQAIRRFYANIENVNADTELVTLRVAGNETAFQFGLTLDFGDAAGEGMRIEPIDVMVFNDDGKIASMKAYWSPDDVTRLSLRSARIPILSESRRVPTTSSSERPHTAKSASTFWACITHGRPG